MSLNKGIELKSTTSGAWWLFLFVFFLCELFFGNPFLRDPFIHYIVYIYILYAYMYVYVYIHFHTQTKIPNRLVSAGNLRFPMYRNDLRGFKIKVEQFGFKRQEDLVNIHAGIAIEQTQYGSMFVWLGNDCFGKLKQTTIFDTQCLCWFGFRPSCMNGVCHVRLRWLSCFYRSISVLGQQYSFLRVQFLIYRWPLFFSIGNHW